MNRRISLILFLCILSACATHEYQIDGNDMIFVLRKPAAKNVVLLCSLDGFKPRAAKNESGRWKVNLPADKTFRYFYWIDGVAFLPGCPMKEKDDFGSENCIFDPHQ